MIDVPVVQYFGLTGGSMWSQVLILPRAVSPSWTRYYTAGAGLWLVLVSWSRRIERVG